MLVYFRLDLVKLFVGNRASVTEVEAQSLRRHEGTGLAHMLAQFPPQYRVQNMRRRVVEHNFLPMFPVDEELYFVADLHSAFFHSAAMSGELRRRVLGIDDFKHVAARSRDRAAVAHLPTGFAVKRRLGREQVDFFAFDRFRFAAAAAEDRKNRGFVGETIVAGETNRLVQLNLGFHRGCFARFATASALLLHELLETRLVHAQTLAAQDVFGQVERKAVGVVEAKGNVAGQDFTVLGFQLGRRVFQED